MDMDSFWYSPKEWRNCDRKETKKYIKINIDSEIFSKTTNLGLLL